MIERFQQSWYSFRRLPLWVQIWVGAVLIPVNAAAFWLLDSWSGQMAAWAAVFVVATNVPIMLRARGMSRLMAVPHLLAWGPLQLALLARLGGQLGSLPLTAAEQTYTVILVLVNGVSLMFDALDAWRWFSSVWIDSLRSDSTV